MEMPLYRSGYWLYRYGSTMLTGASSLTYFSKRASFATSASIFALVSAGVIVITVGGGGIPVVETGTGLKGVAAVIDKDRASSLLARDVKADQLIILTAVDRVCVNFNKPDQQELPSMTLAEAEEYIKQGQFAPGSMLPKVQSCMEFVASNTHGGTALITSLARAAEALDGKTGTVVEK